MPHYNYSQINTASLFVFYFKLLLINYYYYHYKGCLNS